MRARLETIAPYLSWLGLILILGGLLLPVYLRQSSTVLPAWLPWALAGAGVVLLLAWPLLRPDDLRTVLGARQTRFGGNALILAISVIGALILVNFLGTRKYVQWDLTSNKQYSISRQTIQILDDLDTSGQNVTLTAVLQSNDYQTTSDLQKLIDRYRAHTGNVEFKQIDPQVDRLELLGLAERIGMADAPPSQALIAEMGDKHEIVYTGFDEQAVTEAIVKVMRTDKRKVAFTTGHDEFDPEDSGERGYSKVKAQLEREGYAVEKVNLATITSTLSADTFDVLVVAGPRKPFLPQEARALAGYNAGGGSLLVMLDPTVDANLGAVLLPWEIRPHDDVVVQPNMLGLTASVAAAGDAYQFHTITKDLSSLNTVFVGTRSLGLGTAVTTSMQTTALVQVGESGEWGETDLSGMQSGNVAKDEADTPSPLVLAVAAEETAASETEGEEGAAAKVGYGRLVVFGTSLVAADELLTQLGSVVGNFNMFLNAVSWLAQEEALVSIRPTEPNDRPIQAPSSPWPLLLALAVLVPLAVLAAGTWVYWRRR